MNQIDTTRLLEIRLQDPDAVLAAAAARTTRSLAGRMMLVAADHPARGALGVGARPLAMANRSELLGRLVTALGRPGVDGVLGSPDILEDLLLLGALEGKLVIGSMNRGGLLGAAFELDDRFTAYDAASIAKMRFDGGKMLTRIALADRGSLRTIVATAQAISELADRGLMAMVEPFWSSMVDGKVRHDLSPEGVIKSVAIVSGLGTTTRHTWLKLPVIDQMERVMEATTFPTMLLGGDPSGPADDTYAQWSKALTVPGVVGLVVGRALLYPEDDDVAAAVDIASSLVHDRPSGS